MERIEAFIPSILWMMRNEDVVDWNAWTLRRYVEIPLKDLRLFFPTAVHLIFFILQNGLEAHFDLKKDFLDRSLDILLLCKRYPYLFRKIWLGFLKNPSLSLMAYERLPSLYQKNIEGNHESILHYQKKFLFFISILPGFFENFDVMETIALLHMKLQKN